jgi:valyl-tRNA synthetase
VHAEGLAVELDTAAGLDVEAERARLRRGLAAATAEVDATSRKLANPAFVDRAPAEVVAKNRDRLAGAQREVAHLTERIAALS